ncbi:MAG: signal peptidase I [Alphaproteobacteria bacterium]|nr:signal peptidase I [Alphaproteobacteria bacterium]MBF0128540.1 signal peptidase I [Alphaproteobacteria bacterium]
MRKSHSGGMIDTIKTVFYAVLIALLVRTIAFEPFNIPSGSMIPTLLIGDYLFVSKYSYGYSRYSLPFGLPLIPGRLFQSEPEQGDVAVFALPSDTSLDYIKRVIGLPGDRVQMIGGHLHINGKPVRRERTGDFVGECSNNIAMFSRFTETLPNGVRHTIIELTDSGPYDDTREYVVPEGHYFMMGDNRDCSNDSRADVGYVPIRNFVGRAEVLFFSKDDSARFWEIWKWPLALRYSRFFQGVH